ncbi:TetR/AcrR family transcriptional regulator [Poseidonibacter ostreae]|uniref:TetR family transcriptional regulator n=1 Tax=Poseidonibacter ostreae TaxID=2654171 RepID=A0A6L4WMT1_9BACT|nr:TetR/AcrR family transcriptional regulator [Poseidonibacter ostreae]KAB7881178.1 TetR family transcriptional regulator [Poseidonibacter ostreae]KAB7883048.1 TetR family transcriptional regulator [Poseidonibacter ostreae]KAB7886056.1 TetR family transcriptional regulator [Poseidonibacter ostreae]
MDIRQKILDKAFEEIHKSGYEAASINKILKDVGVNKGSMYHYFKSKRELTLTMIKENLNNYIEQKYGVILEVKENYIQEILKVFRKSSNQSVCNGCRLNNLVQELSHRDNDFKVELEKIYIRFEEIIEEAIIKAIENKEIFHPNPKRLSIYLVASLEGSVATAKKSQDFEIYNECIDEIENYLNSLKCL